MINCSGLIEGNPFIIFIKMSDGRILNIVVSAKIGNINLCTLISAIFTLKLLLQ